MSGLDPHAPIPGTTHATPEQQRAWAEQMRDRLSRWFQRDHKQDCDAHAVYRLLDGSWSGPFPSLPTSEVPNSESAADVRSALTDGLYPEGRKR